MEQEQFEALYPENARAEEIAEIVAFVKKGASCQLIGIPGVSRSTLLGLLAYNKKIRLKHLGAHAVTTHFVPVNFSEIRKRPLFDAMKFIFLSISDSLRERKMLEEYHHVSGLFKEHLDFHDELVLFQGLKQAISYLALERKISIVLLFDRFEEYIPNVTNEFFSNMRILRNTAKYQFSIVFSLNRPLESVLDPASLADFYEFVAGHLVSVRLYDAVSTSFRISYIEKVTDKKLPKEQLQKVLALTGGHGKLNKLAAEALLAHEEKIMDLEAFLLSQKSIRGALQEIWLSLSPAEQADLQQGNFDDQEVLLYFEEIGLIRDKRLQIPLFEKYIQAKERSTSDALHIEYDEHTNTIKKGQIVLSDQLTSSEFRLLRYLLQNQERVIERDELINIVWASVKSTAGITDQAVDQLIFRVRRKIEEDPNNPTHLQTVKGRGFKFIS